MAMKGQIEHDFTMTVVGRNWSNRIPAQLASVWNDFYEEFSEEQLSSLGPVRYVAVCHSFNPEGGFDYLAGTVVDEEEQARILGLDVLTISTTDLAKIRVTGPVPECIHQGWKFAMDDYLPAAGYRFTGGPVIECYYPGDNQASDYQMELWFSVDKMKGE